jgi:uncharacterized protein YqjF (DUF2071 family)
MILAAHPAVDVSREARRRFLAREKRPLLRADWMRVLFLHYEMPAKRLQPFVPFELDRWEGSAFVSLVAFSMERVRVGFGGPLGQWLLGPFSDHEFFNVRTYVKHKGLPGIFFISERLNNRLSALAGPITYGLPYRFARIEYAHHPDRGLLAGTVGGAFRYEAEISRDASFQISDSGSPNEFLIERYTAFTSRGRHSRRFDIWHEPWRQTPVEACITNDCLLRDSFPWFAEAKFVGANYSPGVRDVWMGAPHLAIR